MPPPPAAVEVEGVTDTSGVTIPDPLAAPLAVNELHGRRRAHQKSQWGVAAPSMTESFKLRDHSHKPKAKSWDREWKSCPLLTPPLSGPAHTRKQRDGVLIQT